VPIYRRGLYFDGTEDFVQFKSLVLPHTFTLEFWIKPSEIKGTLFSMTQTASNQQAGDEDYFAIYLLSGTNNAALWYYNPAGVLSDVQATTTNESITVDVWQQLLVGM
jgi:hypothetical protein